MPGSQVWDRRFSSLSRVPKKSEMWFRTLPTFLFIKKFWDIILYIKVIVKNITAPEDYVRELLTLMLLVANLANTKGWKKPENDWNPGKWVLIWEYSTRAIQWIPTRQGLVSFQGFCVLVLWMKVASALEGLSMNGLTNCELTVAMICHDLWLITMGAWECSGSQLGYKQVPCNNC